MNRRDFIRGGAVAGIAGHSALVGQQVLRPKSLGEVPLIFSASYTFTLSGAAAVMTLQQPASGARNVRLVAVSVYSSVAIDITQERNGTAATATALSVGTTGVTRVNPDRTESPTALVYRSSDVGVGTAIGGAPDKLTAAGRIDFEFPNTVFLIGSGTAKNYTIRTSSVTGTVIVSFVWEEYL